MWNARMVSPQAFALFAPVTDVGLLDSAPTGSKPFRLVVSRQLHRLEIERTYRGFRA
jgi:hypothetical protein